MSQAAAAPVALGSSLWNRFLLMINPELTPKGSVSALLRKGCKYGSWPAADVCVVKRGWAVCWGIWGKQLRKKRWRRVALSLSVTSHSLKSYSFIYDTVGLVTVLNLEASWRFTKHLLLYDSKMGIINRVDSIPVRVKARKEAMQFLLSSLWIDCHSLYSIFSAWHIDCQSLVKIL